MTAANTIYLASDSPRRKKLLKQLLGDNFRIIKNSHVEDHSHKLSPENLAKKHAEDKAVAAMNKIDSGIIIAADTIVVCGGKILGKPKDKKDAARMLRRISGKIVKVVTGIAIINPKSPSTSLGASQALNPKQIPNSKFKTGTGKINIDSEETLVKIKTLTDDEIDWYVKTKEPLDKAGAFAIQGKGSFLVEWFKGDYNNVVGLPLYKLEKMLKHVKL
jgi:septum formation protein